MIAVDSSSFIAFVQNDKGTDVNLVTNSFRNKDLILPPSVQTEILSDPKLTKDWQHIISNLPILDISDGFWERSGKTRSIILSKKLKARLADTLVAQACIDSNVPLITRDKDFRHFAKHCGLKLAA